MKHLYPVSRTIVPIASPAALTAADVTAYQRTGFLAVENVLTPEEIASAKHTIDALLHERIGGVNLMPEPDSKAQFAAIPSGERAHLIRKLMHFVDVAPELKTISEQSTVLRIVESLIGEESQMIQDMALVKPAHIGSEKPWHQDLAYFDWHPANGVIGVWIALDAATVENGCMFVLPGSQSAGPVAHIHNRDCQIPDERVEIEKSVAVPLAPGGALFFHSLLHHGTPPNDSVMSRSALQFHYAGVSCTQRSLREHAGDFFEGDVYGGCRTPRTMALSEI